MYFFPFSLLTHLSSDDKGKERLCPFILEILIYIIAFNLNKKTQWKTGFCLLLEALKTCSSDANLIKVCWALIRTPLVFTY